MIFIPVIFVTIYDIYKLDIQCFAAVLRNQSWLRRITSILSILSLSISFFFLSPPSFNVGYALVAKPNTSYIGEYGRRRYIRWRKYVGWLTRLRSGRVVLNNQLPSPRLLLLPLPSLLFLLLLYWFQYPLSFSPLLPLPFGIVAIE